MGPGQSFAFDSRQESSQPSLMGAEDPARRQPPAGVLARQGLRGTDVQHDHVQGASGPASRMGQPPSHPTPAAAVVDEQGSAAAQFAARPPHVPQPRPGPVRRIGKPGGHARLTGGTGDAGIDHGGGIGPRAEQRALPAAGKPGDHDRRVERVREPEIPTGRASQVDHPPRGYVTAGAWIAEPVRGRPAVRSLFRVGLGARVCAHRCRPSGTGSEGLRHYVSPLANG